MKNGTNIIEFINMSKNDRWIIDYEKKKLETEFINLVMFERYFSHMSRTQKATRAGMSEGHYNRLKQKHGLQKGGKNEEIINSTICRDNVLDVWSWFICR